MCAFLLSHWSLTCAACLVPALRQARHLTNSSLFVYRNSTTMAYLLIYVDDLILSASTPALLHLFINNLKSAFAVKDMGPVHYFLGVDVKRMSDGFFLSQSTYALDILDRASMTNCKPVATPAEPASKVSQDDDALLSKIDVSWYRSMVGALQYLTLTHPDLAYAVQQVCLHMSKAPPLSACTCSHRPPQRSQRTLMPIGQVAPIFGVPPPNSPSSLATPWCRGLPRDRPW